MRHLLLVSYFWPPFGGAGVQRALKLAQAAPEFGWRVSVVAAQPHQTDAQDPSLLTDQVATVPVQRVDHRRIGGRLWRLRSWTPPDPYRLWKGPAAQAAMHIAASDPIDAVLSTSMPYTAHLVALQLCAQLDAENPEKRRLPWVADLRDPWTDNRFHAYYRGGSIRSRFRRWTDAKMERATYDRADLVSVTSAGLRDLLIRQHGLAPDRVILARNGYDEADFAGVLPLPGTQNTAITATAQNNPRSAEPMKLLFAGSMYAGYTIEAFFAALQLLRTQRADVSIELTAHTQSAGLLKRLCADFPLAGECVKTGPRVTHEEVVKLYGQADALVLATLDHLSIPGKLFEYIRSGTPVLAFAVPGAESWAMLRDTGCGIAVPHDDVQAGAAAIGDLYDRWRDGKPLTQPVAEAVELLQRKVAYQTLLSALDAVVNAS